MTKEQLDELITNERERLRNMYEKFPPSVKYEKGYSVGYQEGYIDGLRNMYYKLINQ